MPPWQVALLNGLFVVRAGVGVGSQESPEWLRVTQIAGLWLPERRPESGLSLRDSSLHEACTW